MRLTIAGNSHVVALQDAVERAGLDEVSVFPLGSGRYESQPFSRVENGKVRMTIVSYKQNLRRHTGRASIDPSRVWGFLSVNHNARIYRHGTWTTHEPSAVASAHRQPVSADVLRTIIERDQVGIRTLFAHLQEASVIFLALSAPPPRRDHPALDKGITAATILHIDRTAREVWATWLTERSIPLIDPSAESADSDGFLREDLASKEVINGVVDRNHANGRYGALLLDQLARHPAVQ